MISPQFVEIFKQFQSSTLSTLHQSLNIQDKIQALIRKQRLFTYPEGTDIAGKFF
jgi:hypothetical protein